MQELGLRLMISLDGFGEAHDRHRHYKNGKGSFGKVQQAIALCLEKGLIPDISITVSGRNAKDLPQVVAWVLEKELPFSINFYRENDLSAQHQDLAFEDEVIISGMRAAYKVIESNLPQRSLLGALLDRTNLSAPHQKTCSVGDNYLVFDTKGNIAKCQMQIDKPVSSIDAPDPLKDIQTDLSGIQNLSVDDKEDCKDCEWKYWCAGGCPLSTYRATGRYDVKSPYCNIYKALFPEVIRLEGLSFIEILQLTAELA